MGSRKEEIVEEIPDKLYDDSAKITYKRLRFFGKVNSSFHLEQAKIPRTFFNLLLIDPCLMLSFIPYPGRLCKMLRDRQCRNERDFRRKDRVEEADDEAQSEGKDDSRDSDP